MLLRMPLARFRIDTDATTSTITVNDEPVPGLIAFQLTHAQGSEVPVLTLVVRSVEGVTEGEGVVHVKPELEDVKAVLLSVLDAIDPAQLERDALDGLGFGDETLAEAIVKQVRALAEQLAP